MAFNQSQMFHHALSVGDFHHITALWQCGDIKLSAACLNEDWCAQQGQDSYLFNVVGLRVGCDIGHNYFAGSGIG